MINDTNYYRNAPKTTVKMSSDKYYISGSPELGLFTIAPSPPVQMSTITVVRKPEPEPLPALLPKPKLEPRLLPKPLPKLKL